MNVSKDWNRSEIDAEMQSLIKIMKLYDAVKEVIPIGSFLTMNISHEIDLFVIYKAAKV